jgi:hypothetical protein
VNTVRDAVLAAAASRSYPPAFPAAAGVLVARTASSSPAARRDVNSPQLRACLADLLRANASDERAAGALRAALATLFPSEAIEVLRSEPRDAAAVPAACAAVAEFAAFSPDAARELAAHPGLVDTLVDTAAFASGVAALVPAVDSLARALAALLDAEPRALATAAVRGCLVRQLLPAADSDRVRACVLNATAKLAQTAPQVTGADAAARAWHAALGRVSVARWGPGARGALLSALAACVTSATPCSQLFAAPVVRDAVVIAARRSGAAGALSDDAVALSSAAAVVRALCARDASTSWLGAPAVVDLVVDILESARSPAGAITAVLHACAWAAMSAAPAATDMLGQLLSAVVACVLRRDARLFSSAAAQAIAALLTSGGRAPIPDVVTAAARVLIADDDESRATLTLLLSAVLRVGELALAQSAPFCAAFAALADAAAKDASLARAWSRAACAIAAAAVVRDEPPLSFVATATADALAAVALASPDATVRERVCAAFDSLAHAARGAVLLDAAAVVEALVACGQASPPCRASVASACAAVALALPAVSELNDAAMLALLAAWAQDAALAPDVAAAASAALFCLAPSWSAEAAACAQRVLANAERTCSPPRALALVDAVVRTASTHVADLEVLVCTAGGPVAAASASRGDLLSVPACSALREQPSDAAVDVLAVRVPSLLSLRRLELAGPRAVRVGVVQALQSAVVAHVSLERAVVGTRVLLTPLSVGRVLDGELARVRADVREVVQRANAWVAVQQHALRQAVVPLVLASRDVAAQPLLAALVVRAADALVPRAQPAAASPDEPRLAEPVGGFDAVRARALADARAALVRTPLHDSARAALQRCGAAAESLDVATLVVPPRLADTSPPPASDAVVALHALAAAREQLRARLASCRTAAALAEAAAGDDLASVVAACAPELPAALDALVQAAADADARERDVAGAHLPTAAAARAALAALLQSDLLHRDDFGAVLACARAFQALAALPVPHGVSLADVDRVCAGARGLAAAQRERVAHLDAALEQHHAATCAALDEVVRERVLPACDARPAVLARVPCEVSEAQLVRWESDAVAAHDAVARALAELHGTAVDAARASEATHAERDACTRDAAALDALADTLQRAWASVVAPEHARVVALCASQRERAASEQRALVDAVQRWAADARGSRGLLGTAAPGKRSAKAVGASVLPQRVLDKLVRADAVRDVLGASDAAVQRAATRFVGDAAAPDSFVPTGDDGAVDALRASAAALAGTVSHVSASSALDAVEQLCSHVDGAPPLLAPLLGLARSEAARVATEARSADGCAQQLQARHAPDAERCGAVLDGLSRGLRDEHAADGEAGERAERTLRALERGWRSARACARVVGDLVRLLRTASPAALASTSAVCAALQQREAELRAACDALAAAQTESAARSERALDEHVAGALSAACRTLAASLRAAPGELSADSVDAWCASLRAGRAGVAAMLLACARAGAREQRRAARPRAPSRAADRRRGRVRSRSERAGERLAVRRRRAARDVRGRRAARAH